MNNNANDPDASGLSLLITSVRVTLRVMISLTLAHPRTTILATEKFLSVPGSPLGACECPYVTQSKKFFFGFPMSAFSSQGPGLSHRSRQGQTWAVSAMLCSESLSPTLGQVGGPAPCHLRINSFAERTPSLSCTKIFDRSPGPKSTKCT